MRRGTVRQGEVQCSRVQNGKVMWGAVRWEERGDVVWCVRRLSGVGVG